MNFPHPKRHLLTSFLKEIREEFISSFEKIEKSSFSRKKWNYRHQGGGEIALLRGAVFEKAAVNWSDVAGLTFPLAEQEGPFLAVGVSLITHMTNPHAPTAHFNLRFIETENRFWFGGGYDLTPMGFSYAEDTEHFHRTTEEALQPFEGIYDQFSKNAKDYFYIPHHKKERGIGGLFFDHWNTGNFDEDYQLWSTIGRTFLPALIPIYYKRVEQPFTSKEKEVQLHARAHYVEFNLLYDRGTKFGFQSEGNPEAILCSLPPLVKW